MQGRGCRAAHCRQGSASQADTQFEKAALTGEGDPSAQEPAQEEEALPLGVVPTTPLVHQALFEQRNAFIERFGREPGPGDFFDPGKDVPSPIDPARMDDDLEKALQHSGIDPAKAEAIRKLLR